MTFIEIEETHYEPRELAQADERMVKCSWCGQIIHLDGHELALAMCQSCFDQMLAEFLRSQQAREDIHASDR